MSFSRGIQKRKNTEKSSETESSSSCLLNENVFPGLIFKKNINNTKSTLTTLKSRPNVILSEKNIVIFDYSGTKNEEDLNIIHSTFSTMTSQTSTFILNNARFVQDVFSIDKVIDGTYQFLNFMNGNLVVAKAPSNLGNYDKMKWEGKYFIKTPQIEIFDAFSSSKNIDKVINLIEKPGFGDWGIIVGDTIKFIGTKYNDDNPSMVISINDKGNEMSLSEIPKNENSVGLPIKMQHYRKCSAIETFEVNDPQETIEVSFNKKVKVDIEGLCPKGWHWMAPDKTHLEGWCMEGTVHGRVAKTSTPRPTTTRTSTPRPSTPRPSTPRPSTPRTSTPRPSTPRPRTSTPRPTPRPSTPRTTAPRTSTPSTPSSGGGGMGGY